MNRYREYYNELLERHFKIRWMIDAGIRIKNVQIQVMALQAKIQWCDKMASKQEWKEFKERNSLNPNSR